MLNRYRTVLAFTCFGRDPTARGLSRTRLMKYAFLLSLQHKGPPKGATYEFVPYRYGPFSFALCRDLANLQRDRFITSVDKNPRFVVPGEIEGQVRAEISRLPRSIQSAIQEIVAKYGLMSQETLLREVYSRFPWYALYSERQDLIPSPMPERPRADIAVYTLGYEGRTVDGFFDGLLRKGVRTIIDVRCNPVSRKYGFARSSMANIAQKLALQYVHMPELGISAERRKNLTTAADRADLLDWYERTLSERAEAIDQALELIRSAPSVLVCAEWDPGSCHRGRLARWIGERAELPLCHLGNESLGLG